MYLLVAALLAAAPAEDKSKGEENIQGTWTVVSRERDGKKTPDADLKALKVTIKDGTMTIDDGKKKEKTPYKIDPSKKPKTIDLANTGRAEKEATAAIYELDGDTLKICWSEKDPYDYPTEFTGKADSGQTMWVFKREKKPAEKTDEEKIQGNWTVVSHEMVGKKTLDAELNAWPKWIIKGGTITADDGKKKEFIPYKLDPSKKPKAIDLTMELAIDGKGKKTYPYIYELDGDTLKLCWSEKDPDHRPTKFASDEESGQAMIVFNREKMDK